MNLYALKIITQMSKQPGDFQVKINSNQYNSWAKFLLHNKFGRLHSLHSPAVFTIRSPKLGKETVSFSEVWFNDGKYHRLDGPAYAIYSSDLETSFAQYWHYGFRVIKPD